MRTKSYILSFVRNSGSNDMITLRENRAAYSRLRLLPKILIDVSKVSTGTTMYICVYKYMSS
jgi:isopentenyl diphosphate isomerase/L-lactate dehydrogenase-like FMN-dependent dehydrogenase